MNITFPLISIVIPVFNMEKYIQRCILSLFYQSYNNIEIIIVDDGSTDNLKKVVENLKYNNLIYVYQDNQGVSSARNRGIDLAKGDFIIFLDADDFIDSKFVESLLSDLLKENSQLSICGHTKIFDSNISVKSRSKKSKIKYENFIKEFFDRNSLLTKLCCDKIFSLKVIKENKLYFPLDVPSGQDQVFILAYILKIKKITTIKNNLYYYYQSNNSKSRSYQFNTFIGTLKKLDCFFDIMSNENLFIRNKKLFLKRVYMNLFSQGFLAYKHLNSLYFKDTYLKMRVKMKEYITKYKSNTMLDVIFLQSSFSEKIVILTTFFSPIIFVRVLFKIYLYVKNVWISA